ncbi:hypothetical protein [Cupriavidus pinatubonensis]|uniref:hypothetical protein n=1 Tax=Cupriavidus pinatubonensis TaxID=248026 RepID=UPI00112CF400|nr:hypothetical protein [Cupriavidus pinatubonensis]
MPGKLPWAIAVRGEIEGATSQYENGWAVAKRVPEFAVLRKQIELGGCWTTCTPWLGRSQSRGAMAETISRRDLFGHRKEKNAFMPPVVLGRRRPNFAMTGDLPMLVSPYRDTAYAAIESAWSAETT